MRRLPGFKEYGYIPRDPEFFIASQLKTFEFQLIATSDMRWTIEDAML